MNDRDDLAKKGNPAVGFVVVVGIIVLLAVGFGLISDFVWYRDDAPSRHVQRMQARAESGEAEAQYWMGRYLREGRDNLPADPVMARSWFETASRQGHIGATYEMGQAHRFGRGGPVDYQKALTSFLDAEAAGSTPATNAIGELYARGQGMQQNSATAVMYFRRAAEAGFAPAQRNLALAAFNGEGIERDPMLALDWYLKAADQGDVLALNNLGIMYENGQSVDVDKGRAYGCYFSALLDGYKPAGEAVKRLSAYAIPKTDERYTQYVSCVTGEVYSIGTRPRLRP